MAGLSPITIARFWSKIQVGRDTDCWLWRGGEDYGRFKIDGVLHLPHRLAYELVNGPIPEGEGFHGTVVRRKWSKHNAKITAEQAAKIRQDPRASRLIAKEYGIGRSQVQRIKNGERWKEA